MDSAKAFSDGGGDVCRRRLPKPMSGPDMDIPCHSAHSRLPTLRVGPPARRRMRLEGVIRDHLDVGRPDQIARIFHFIDGCVLPGPLVPE